MGSSRQALIPGLPDDIALKCLAKLPHGFHGAAECVSKGWKDLIRSADYSNYKAKEGWHGSWMFVLTEESRNQWVAYDPEADRWHPLPKVTGHRFADWQHYGFACVCVGSKFMLIGGSYTPRDPVFPHERPMITNHVMEFDPYTKVWRRLSNMRTPRSHFACSVLSGKVYVAGGRTLLTPSGLNLAEVYDPVTKKWEDLPSMTNPQMDCLGLSYKGKYYVLSDQTGLPDHKTSEVFDPKDKKWRTVEDIWPFSRAMHLGVQIMKDNRVYTVVDWGESSIKTRDSEKGDWQHVGLVPPVVLSDHPRPLEAFGYGFSALHGELYVLGGRVLRWEDTGLGKFDIVRLATVRVCEPSVTPLKWRETVPMCGIARGSILGCAAMEHDSSIGKTKILLDLMDQEE
jgi:hypothetical protein